MGRQSQLSIVALWRDPGGHSRDVRDCQELPSPQLRGYVIKGQQRNGLFIKVSNEQSLFYQVIKISTSSALALRRAGQQILVYVSRVVLSRFLIRF
jgi:hypothetical protein